jgi:hypothetical protein
MFPEKVTIINKRHNKMHGIHLIIHIVTKIMSSLQYEKQNSLIKNCKLIKTDYSGTMMTFFTNVTIRNRTAHGTFFSSHKDPSVQPTPHTK